MPNGGLEKVGVELIAEGADKFISSLEKATEGLDKFTAATTAAPAATAGMGAGAAAATAGPIALGVAVAGAALKIGEMLVSAIGNAVGAMKQFAAEGVMLAGRFQEMEFTALAVGRAMGLQEQEIRGAISAVQDAGIRYDAAATTVAQFARNQINLASATELANIAQATGILIGEDSSATMQRLTTAVATGSTVRLRALGIIFDNQEALEAEAATLGKSVEAMTQAEKAQARVNAIIAAGKPLLDVYSAAMESPTKAMRSLAGRVIPELQASIGQFFLPALMTVVSAVKNFVEALTAATEEGGALRPILINLGAAASLLADAFAGALGFLTDWVSSFQGTLFGGMSATAEGMIRWGFEIVAALAEGMVNAASTVLITAMNIIGDVLASWLGPGSPPRVAPGLTDWGAAAMTEYLKGFIEADFSILKAVQGPLQQILSRPEFAAVTQQLTFELATGGVDESFFGVIAQAAGEFGTEIAELARRQHALALATTAVEESERRLESTRKAQKKAQADVGRLTREYNELLREGASKDILDAKMDELKAAEERVSVTAQQAAEAEAETEAARTQQATLEEQLTLQKQLVDQLLLVARAQQETAQQTEAATGRATRSVRGLGEELRGLTGAMPTAAEFDIASRIGAAIDEAKDRLKKKLGTLFKPLLDAWANIKKRVAELEETFEIFKENVSTAWEEIQERISPILEDITLWLEENIPIAIEATRIALLKLKTRFAVVRNYLVTFLLPKLYELRDNALGKIKEASETLAHIWEHTLLPAFRTVRDWIVDHLIPIFNINVPDSITAVIQWFNDNVLIPFANTLNWIVGLVQILLGWIGQLIQALREAIGLFGELAGFVPGSSPNVQSVEEPTGGYGMQMTYVPIAATPLQHVAAGGAQATTTNEWNLNVGPNTLHRPLDIDMLAAAVEQRLMRSMRT